MRRVAYLSVLIGLVAAACGGSDPVVASVNGVDIHQSEVIELRTLDAPTMPASDFRGDLSVLILQGVVGQAAQSQLGVVLDPAGVDAEVAGALETLAVDGRSLEEALGAPGATELMLRRNIEIVMLRDRVIDGLSADPDLIDAIRTDLPDLFTIVCAHHVLVDTEQKALDAKARIDAGESISDIATELSLSGEPGGDLGCSSLDPYVPPFADAARIAPIGETYGPVETEFGWHVLLVSERTEVTLEAILEDPEQYLPQQVMQEEFVSWFNGVLRDSDVVVDASIGEWSADLLGIVPPGESPSP